MPDDQVTCCPVEVVSPSPSESSEVEIIIPNLESPSDTPSESPSIEPPTIREIVCSYDWNCEGALKVAFCESSLNPAATDGGYNEGLFQIAPKYHTRRLREGETLFQAEANTRIAYEIYSEQGREPWPACGRFF